MAFFKFRKRGQPATEAAGRAGAKESAASPQETIDSVRRRARHRLVGAAVLVLLAIIGFPLLFDTQPRPVAVNAPITIPDKDKAAPLKIPDALPADASLDDREEVVAHGEKPAGRAPVPVPVPAPTAPARSALTDKLAAARDARPDPAPDARDKAEAATKSDAGDAARTKAEAAAKAKADQAAARAQREQQARAQRDEERARPTAQARADDQASADTSKKPEEDARAKREAEQRAKREEAARARALLEGRNGAAEKTAAASDKPGRFIVQVGAFADDAAAREARQKAERTGVKTYTQVVDTKDGKRTRVRVGPFASREEADKAAAALKKAGLAGAVLSL